MKKVFLLAAFCLGSLLSNAQTPFEGMIHLRKIDGKDTTNSMFYLKDDKVRLDEYYVGTEDSLETSHLANVNFMSLTTVNHAKKLYMPRATNQKPQVNGEVEVIKTKNAKTVQGVKCTEYMVKNESQGIEVSYWLGKGKFAFYQPFAQMLNPKEDIYKYFLMIDNAPGTMPVEAVLKVNGEEKSKLELTSIQKEGLEEYQFEVPKDYKKFAK